MAVLNMPPTFAPDNAVNCCLMNAEPPCKFMLACNPCRIVRSYLLNIGQRQFGSLMCFSMSLSAFRNLISHICGIFTEKQMRRIDAGWIVAVVANIHSIWNLFIVQYPRKPMCQKRPLLVTNQSIASMIQAACPFPASAFGNREQRTKPLLWRSCLAGFGAVFASSTLDHTVAGTESHAAPFASPHDRRTGFDAVQNPEFRYSLIDCRWVNADALCNLSRRTGGALFTQPIRIIDFWWDKLMLHLRLLLSRCHAGGCTSSAPVFVRVILP